MGKTKTAKEQFARWFKRNERWGWQDCGAPVIEIKAAMEQAYLAGMRSSAARGLKK